MLALQAEPPAAVRERALALSPEIAGQLASLALAFDAKLQMLEHHLDPAWAEVLMTRWGFLGALPDEQVRRHVAARLFSDHCGGLPALERLLDPVAQLVLMDRPSLLQRLCILAVARRPGALRCFIDRHARQVMRQALGEAFEPLMGYSTRGRPVSSVVAQWSPLHWACLGYGDWVGQLRDDDGVLRRIVRLSLPKQLSEMQQLRHDAPADMKTPQALSLLKELGVVWPC